jgi:hypothetical protein
LRSSFSKALRFILGLAPAAGFDAMSSFIFHEYNFAQRRQVQMSPFDFGWL